ncbi:MAG: exodeoxyribonuclease III [Chloroflexi bacterium]|nr:exodeoxyribonuclease III [Chloroflexota bacterium]
MKITSWNVNGLRAALRKGANAWWEEEAPDVLCLQEVRAFSKQLTSVQRTNLEREHAIWNPAQRAGYSGVATFSKQVPLETILGLGEERFDIEGRVIQTRFDEFTLFNIYFPNGQRDHGRLTFKLDFYRYLLEICDKLHARGEKIILCGDFNIAHREIDLKNPKENQGTSGFLPEERDWIDRYIEHGFVDIYRQLHPENEQYSWWTYRHNARQRNIGWRIDYFLVSDGLVPQVQNSNVHDEVLGSDHCPISLVL